MSVIITNESQRKMSDNYEGPEISTSISSHSVQFPLLLRYIAIFSIISYFTHPVMMPISLIVSSPDSGCPLRSGEEGSTKHKWPIFTICSLDQTIVGSFVLK